MVEAWGSLTDILKIIFILIGTSLLVKLQRDFFDRFFRRASKHEKLDATKFNFFKHLLSAVIYIVGASIALYDIPALRTLAVSVLASAGVLAVVIGFAAQEAFSNLISGLFIIIFKPFKVGDRVSIPDKLNITGTIEDITLRHSVIRTFENKRIIIPNSVISQNIIENSNYGDEKICRFVEFNISYEADMDKAMKIMEKEAKNHPYFLDNRTKEEIKQGDPAIPVRVLGFKDSSVLLRAWVWAEDARKAFIMGTDLNKSIKKAFDKAGIEIPYPHRTIVEKRGNHGRKL